MLFIFVFFSFCISLYSSFFRSFTYFTPETLHSHLLFVRLLASHLFSFHDKDDMVNLLLLRPRRAMATVLLSCLVVSSFVILSTESVRARPIAAAVKDPLM